VAAAVTFALISGRATAVAQTADQGGTIFAAKCAACHSIGKGKVVGPDLKGITTTQSHQWLEQWIASPSAVIKAGDPTATALVKQYPLQMPDLGLSPTDVDAVIAYIAAQSGGAASAGAAAAPAIKFPAGDAAIGREIFIGGVKLTHGGPMCMSCHSISGIGALGGGTLGPDLTNAYSKYGGDQGLESFLSSVPTPTMNAVWSKNPLTPAEIADLTAFIKEGAVAQRPPGAIGQLALLAIIGVIILVIIIGWYWRKRLLGVRIPLVQRADMVFLSKESRRS
jgi:cytochrome c2